MFKGKGESAMWITMSGIELPSIRRKVMPSTQASKRVEGVALPKVGRKASQNNTTKPQKPRRPAKRRLDVFACIEFAQHRGCTSDEIEYKLWLSHGTVSARLHELERSGKIKRTSVKRMTRWGGKASVYVVA